MSVSGVQGWLLGKVLGLEDAAEQGRLGGPWGGGDTQWWEGKSLGILGRWRHQGHGLDSWLELRRRALLPELRPQKGE